MDFLNHDVFIYGYTMEFCILFRYIFLCSFEQVYTGEIININEVVLLLVSIVDYISALIEKNMKCA